MEIIIAYGYFIGCKDMKKTIKDYTVDIVLIIFALCGIVWGIHSFLFEVFSDIYIGTVQTTLINRWLWSFVPLVMGALWLPSEDLYEQFRDKWISKRMKVHFVTLFFCALNFLTWAAGIFIWLLKTW